MVEVSAEQFVQTAFNLNLLDENQQRALWAELGTRHVAFEQLRQALSSRNLLTNYQIDRLLKGERGGFFYGAYKVLYLVGTGTFSRVYRAVHTETGKVVAVKVLRHRFSDDAEQVEHFQNEGYVGMKLRHPNIVPVYEVGSEGYRHFMVMDFIEGQTLREFLKIRRKFEPLDATRLIAGATTGLEYAFQKGITHRDLKLSNVLVSSRGQAKLVDFGLAAQDKTVRGKDHITDMENPRTIDYAGLERATGVRKDDRRSDIYFMGCMYYHLLTGKSPLKETKARTERLNKSHFTDVVPVTTVAPDLPAFAVHIVQKAMDLDPDHRYQTPGEMLVDLKIAIDRLSKGDTAEDVDEEEVAEVFNEQRKRLAPAAATRTLMFVESNHRMQDMFRKQLRNMGYRVLVTIDPQRALIRLREDQNPADCLIFSTRELGKSALTAFNQLADEDDTQEVKAVLLLDKQHSNWQTQAHVANGRVVVTMPVKLKRFQHVLNQLVPLN